MNKTLWLFRDRVSMDTNRIDAPAFKPVPWIELYTNGWSLGWRCLAITLRVGRRVFGVTFWQLPSWKRHWDD